MEDKNIDAEIANQKIDIYVAVREILAAGRPVTMYGISRYTSMDPSYIWKNFGLRGDLMKIIEDAQEEHKVRQRRRRGPVPPIKGE